MKNEFRKKWDKKEICVLFPLIDVCVECRFWRAFSCPLWSWACILLSISADLLLHKNVEFKKSVYSFLYGRLANVKLPWFDFLYFMDFCKSIEKNWEIWKFYIGRVFLRLLCAYSVLFQCTLHECKQFDSDGLQSSILGIRCSSL